jgi:tetratricopeptide (TPR) repeat protein|eukprot:Transcript_9472.p2 GENE.Transcript_9472~~Transcript_9472.p2  ORF type:complete len:305 (+),score=113.53 Transcript_9472:42-917(+)
MAEEAKALGNAAFKAKNFKEAVEHFTTAIASDPKSHVLYSNRSAANAALEEYKAALLDANKCIDLSPDWAKGHSRRGAAYVGLKNWRAALGAYEAGLALDPENANMKEELAWLKAKLGGSGGDPSMPNGPPPPSAQPARAGHGVIGRLAAPLNALLLLSAFLYMVPLLGPRRAVLCYRVACGAALVLYASSIFARHPLKLSSLRDPAVTGSHEAQLSLICLMMLVSPPLPFAVVPFAAYAVHSVATSYGSAVSKLPAMLQGALQPRLTWLLTEEGANMVQVRSRMLRPCHT